jgi:hypothetical protein
MTEFDWVEGPLEGEAETDYLEFHAVDPDAFIAGLRLDTRRREWVLDVTLREGEHEFASCPERRLEVGADKFAWADSELSRLLRERSAGE